jgi:hypothetical protein
MLSNVIVFSFLSEVEDQPADPVQRVQEARAEYGSISPKPESGTQRSLVKMLRACLSML